MQSSFEELIIKSLQKTSSEREEQLLNAWLLEDDDNIELYCHLKEILNSNKVLSKEEIVNRWNEFSMKITNKKKQTSPSRFRYILTHWKSYSAAVGIGFIISILTWFNLRPNTTVLTEIVNNNVVYNDSGVKKIILPDSSVVWLEPNTKLVYPEKFAKNERLLTLTGKAFFEVSKDKQKPFIVGTDNIKIQVTGTEFFVESERDSKEASITLISGGVMVNVLNEEKGTITSTHLKPKEQSNIDKISGHQSISVVDVNPYLIWKDGEYTFENESFENIAKLLAFRFEKEIPIDPSLKNRRFTGKINSDHELYDALHIIDHICPIRYTITDSTVFIYKK